MEEEKIIIEDIDIDKYKENFEYEMTQVILELKGMFSVISDKDTHFSEHDVDEKKLIVGTHKIPEIELNEIKTDKIEVKRPDNPEIKNVNVTYSKVQVPPTDFSPDSFAKLTDMNVPDIAAEHPLVPSVDIKCDVSNIKNISSNSFLCDFQDKITILESVSIKPINRPITDNKNDIIKFEGVNSPKIDLNRLAVKPIDKEISINNIPALPSLTVAKSYDVDAHFAPAKSELKLPDLADIKTNAAVNFILDENHFSSLGVCIPEYDIPEFNTEIDLTNSGSDYLDNTNVSIPSIPAIYGIDLKSNKNSNEKLDIKVPEKTKINKIELPIFKNENNGDFKISINDIPNTSFKLDNNHTVKKKAELINSFIENYEVNVPDFNKDIATILADVQK